MIKREDLDEIESLINEYRMALDFKENMDNSKPFMVLPLANPVTIVMNNNKKAEVNSKVLALEDKIREKLAKLATGKESTQGDLTK